MSQAVPDPDQADVRAQLRSLAEQGVISAVELEQRLAQLGAGTMVAPASALTPFAAMPVAAGYSPQDRLQVVAGLSSERRRGRWTMPPFLRVQAAGSQVRLDCREATAVSAVIDIEVSGGLGRVKIVLPEGWGMNVDRLTTTLGKVVVRVPGEPVPGCPLLWVHGSLGIGGFKAVVRRRRNR